MLRSPGLYLTHTNNICWLVGRKQTWVSLFNVEVVRSSIQTKRRSEHNSSHCQSSTIVLFSACSHTHTPTRSREGLNCVRP